MGRATWVLFSAALIAWAGEAAATTIYVDQDASYHYINATPATQIGAPPVDWFAPNFNDSGWFVGEAPFSSTATSDTIDDNADANRPFAPGPTPPIPSSYTSWIVDFDPFIRTTFTLAAPTDLTLWIAVDNGIGTTVDNPRNGTGAATGMYINGVFGEGFNAPGLAYRWESVFDIPANLTVAGDNVFAAQLQDHGGLASFVMMMTSRVGSNQPFPTKPPLLTPSPVPEPASIALLGAALVVLGFAVRWRPRT